MSSDIGEPKRKSFRNQSLFLKPSMDSQHTPVAYTQPALEVRIQPDGTHASRFRQLIWLCLKFKGITVHQKGQAGSLRTFLFH